MLTSFASLNRIKGQESDLKNMWRAEFGNVTVNYNEAIEAREDG